MNYRHKISTLHTSTSLSSESTTIGLTEGRLALGPPGRMGVGTDPGSTTEFVLKRVGGGPGPMLREVNSGKMEFVVSTRSVNTTGASTCAPAPGSKDGAGTGVGAGGCSAAG